jgi:hypothetical protein
MPNRFTRQQLCDFIWAQPSRTLATDIGVSDVALTKNVSQSKYPHPTTWLGNVVFQHLISLGFGIIRAVRIDCHRD